MTPWEKIPVIFRNSIIATAGFMIAFALLEFSRRPDVVDVFQAIFKEKYRQTYIVVFISALVLQAIIFPLMALIF